MYIYIYGEDTLCTYLLIKIIYNGIHHKAKKYVQVDLIRL